MSQKLKIFSGKCSVNQIFQIWDIHFKFSLPFNFFKGGLLQLKIGVVVDGGGVNIFFVGTISLLAKFFMYSAEMCSVRD